MNRSTGCKPFPGPQPSHACSCIHAQPTLGFLIIHGLFPTSVYVPHADGARWDELPRARVQPPLPVSSPVLCGAGRACSELLSWFQTGSNAARRRDAASVAVAWRRHAPPPAALAWQLAVVLKAAGCVFAALPPTRYVCLTFGAFTCTWSPAAASTAPKVRLLAVALVAATAPPTATPDSSGRRACSPNGLLQAHPGSSPCHIDK